MSATDDNSMDTQVEKSIIEEKERSNSKKYSIEPDSTSKEDLITEETESDDSAKTADATSDDYEDLSSDEEEDTTEGEITDTYPGQI